MNERCRNLCFHIGLVPLAFCSICLLSEWILITFPENLSTYPEAIEGEYSFFTDDTEAATRHLRFSFAFHALVLLCLMSFLWRPYIRWTIRKAIGSKLLLMPLVLQLLIFQPLVESRCNIYTQYQLAAQTGLAYSVFRICVPILIWGFSSVTFGVINDQHRGAKKMTGNAVRLIIGIACLVLFPLLIISTIICLELFYALVDFSYRSSHVVAAGGAIASITVVLIWIGIWRSSVRYTPLCQLFTGVAVLVFLICSGSYLFLNDENWTLAITGGLGFWFIATGIIWSRYRKHPQVVDGDLDIRPTCPACRYLLTGLAAARCPECGWAGNLEDVICVTEDV